MTSRFVRLANDIVDAKTGSVARAAPKGELTFARDGDHFVVMGDDQVTLGASSQASADFTPSIPDLKPWSVVIADSGRSALVVTIDGTVYVIDAKAKTFKKLVDAHDVAHMNVEDDRRRAITADGHAVAWWDDGGAHALDLDTSKRVDQAVAGKPATLSQVGGDVAVALAGDELHVASLSSGTEIFQVPHVSDVLLGEGGKTVAFIDASQTLETVVVFDVQRKSEIARVAVQDPPSTSSKPGKFAGACGSGPFRLTSLEGTVARLARSCSSDDRLSLDVASHGPPSGEPLIASPNVADEYDLVSKVSRRVGLEPEESTLKPPLWLAHRAKVVLRFKKKDGDHLGVFDAASGKRVVDLAKSDDQTVEQPLVLTPDGATLEGVDAKHVARLWDAQTGKVLYEKPLGN